MNGEKIRIWKDTVVVMFQPTIRSCA